MKNSLSGGKTAEYGLLLALALVLSYVESFIPLSFAVPGVKLGLANIVVLFALYRTGAVPALILSLLRVLLVSFMFGNAFALVYSLSGAILSWGLMSLLKKSGRFSPVGIGIAGGVAHNIGQLLCAMTVLETGRLAYYLPVLLVSGTVAGTLIGLAAGMTIKRLPPTL